MIQEYLGQIDELLTTNPDPKFLTQCIKLM